MAPSSVTIDVPNYMGFYFTGSAGPRYISVRGLVVQHTSMGITFHLGADRVAECRSGTGSLHASFNLYWDNEIGIRVHPGSTNKTFEHETVYENRTSGFVIGCDCASARTDVAVSEGLVTHNGAYGIWIAPGRDVRLRYLGSSCSPRCA